MGEPRARAAGQVTRPGWPPSWVMLGSLVSGGAALALGTGLVVRSETLFGAVWASLFLVAGAVVVLSFVVWVTERHPRTPPAPRRVELDGEQAVHHPRRTGWPTPVGYLVPGALGLWAAVAGLVGGVQENWLWPVLLVVPAVYFLGFPVLWLSGRLRPGGVWVTPTRVVDEHLGLRSELAVRDVAVLSPWATELVVMPHEGVVVEHRTLTPRPWRARLVPDRLVIDSQHLAGGSAALAATIQPVLDSRRRR